MHIIQMFTALSIKKPNKITFEIHNADTAVVNAIRRTILSEIPNVAFYFDPHGDSDIQIIRNTGLLHNEFLAHRISLIPIFLSEKQILHFNKDDYTFRLKVRNTGTSVIPVTSKDIEIISKDGKKHNFFPANPITKNHVLITKLKPNIYNPDDGDIIELEASASKNIAKVFANFSPVSQASFYNKIDPDKAAKAREEAPDKGIFDTLDVYRHFKDKQFVFCIESECAMRPQYIFYKALIVLIKNIKDFMESDFEIRELGMPNFFEIDIIQSNTLGNLFQSLIYGFTIREKVEYIGYYQPHPLKPIVRLKIKFLDENVDVRDFMKENCLKIMDLLENMKREWITFCKLTDLDPSEESNFSK